MTSRPSSLERERRKTVAALVGTGLVLSTLAFAVWAFNRNATRDQLSLDGWHADIIRYNTQYKDNPLAEQVLAQRQRRDALSREWATCLGRLCARTMPASNAAPLETGQSNETDHIDFKVALLDCQRRLQERATAAGATFPGDMGMRDGEPTDHEAPSDLFQLGAIEALLTLAIDHGVKSISDIQCLTAPPPDADTNLTILHHPISMTFETSYAALDEMLGSLTQLRQVFSVSHIRIERIALDQPDTFRVQWVCDALTASPSESATTEP